MTEPSSTSATTRTGAGGAAQAPVAVRRAGPADAAEVTRLRAVMLASVDGSTSSKGASKGASRAASEGVAEEWAERCRAELGELLAGDRMVAMVVDAPDGAGLASAGVGVVDLRLPAPGRLSGRVGHVSSMCTDPQWRRRGYARAVLDAVVDWLREQGCSRVELSASDEGLPLYEQSGFVPPPNPSLRRRLT